MRTLGCAKRDALPAKTRTRNNATVLTMGVNDNPARAIRIAANPLSGALIFHHLAGPDLWCSEFICLSSLCSEIITLLRSPALAGRVRDRPIRAARVRRIRDSGGVPSR